MKRNKGIDVMRTVAIMAVLVYHFYVLTGGNRYADHPIIHNLINVGGEIGVTLFFIISGYGIFLSIDRQMKKNKFSIKTYFEKRCVRILPQYYLSLLIIIFIGPQTAVLGKDGVFGIITHALLIHNFFPSTCGSISTVLWTMGVIFQFYLVSVVLYKLVKKNPVLTTIGSIVFTILCKIIIFHFVFAHIKTEASYYFIYGRQLFTALDNFVIGMFLADYQEKLKIREPLRWCVFGMASVCGIIWCIMPLAEYRHSDSITGYVWSTGLAVFLGIITWFISGFKCENDFWLMKIITFISKYQYGIYLWHFVVTANLLQGSEWIGRIANLSFLLLTVVMIVICTLIGYISTITLEAPDYSKLFKKEEM